MSESEQVRIARILYGACRKYITPEPMRQEWLPTADFLDMASAVQAELAEVVRRLLLKYDGHHTEDCERAPTYDCVCGFTDLMGDRAWMRTASSD